MAFADDAEQAELLSLATDEEVSSSTARRSIGRFVLGGAALLGGAAVLAVGAARFSGHEGHGVQVTSAGLREGQLKESEEIGEALQALTDAIRAEAEDGGLRSSSSKKAEALQALTDAVRAEAEVPAAEDGGLPSSSAKTSDTDKSGEHTTKKPTEDGGLPNSSAKTSDMDKSGEHTTKKPPWANRRGSFMVIGDWGYDPVSHWENINNRTCVKAIGAKMKETMEMLGDVKFVINVGDSFYPSGVASKDDPQWQTKWRDIFPPKVRSVPWYSIYGNHDLHIDPCVCTDDVSKCAQVNADPNNLDFFQMPNYTYYTPVPDFDMEIIGLDLNHFMMGWDKKKVEKELAFSDCEWTPCKDECYDRMKKRMGASMDLFWERMGKSQARNLLVFSHYPTDYFMGGAPDFLNGLRDRSNHNITFFGGHRHSTDQWSTCDISPNTNWLVGGGGGWSCDSDDQGFVVGEIQEDYTVVTYSVLVDKEICCIMPTTTTPPSKPEPMPW